MIYVTDLSTYKYCPRKLYLTKVLKFKPEPKRQIIKGEIVHKAIEEITLAEPKSIEQLDKDNINTFLTSFSEKSLCSLNKVLKEYKPKLEDSGINPKEMLQETWNQVKNEITHRIKTIMDFSKKNDMYGTELAQQIPATYLPELRIYSRKLKLKGRIDLLEIKENKHIPIEIKTGRMPFYEVWPEHKIQIGAYMLLLNQKRYHSEYGVVNYIDHFTKRTIILTEQLEQEIKTTISEVDSTINSEKIPFILKEKNKCQNCNLKNMCRN